ncbi:MAG: TonB-dependent receptor [Saprospiraceae bacterium]|nr:TonB-dependent receptor [Saprospiraceae bacterium]
MKHLLILLLCALSNSFCYSQVTISGNILSGTSDETLSSIFVRVKGEDISTVSDMDGYFEIQVPSLPVTLIVSNPAYEMEEIEATTAFVSVLLFKRNYTDPVVVIGSRFAPRTEITAPVPIDNINLTELQATGQITMDKMLHFTVPSFNSTQQTISDATAHFDPADLRGLGPSRTLTLINGKRKNQSALVYINDTPGKGEVGVDMKTIPAAAIERIEVLRDGAAAQYGSDAIAGVINVILNKDTEWIGANLQSGITLQGDGFFAGADFNMGLPLGKKGFVNFTGNFYRQNETNRAPEVGTDSLFGVYAGDSSWGTWLSDFPNLGMRVGQPNITQGNFVLNMEVPVTKWLNFYNFGGFTYRYNKSYALYRPPYWIPDPYNLLHDESEIYNGFQPTFESEILDHNFTLGFKGKTAKWNYDLSVSSGSNHVNYTTKNTLNPSLEGQSPTIFSTGGYRFLNLIGNLDIARLVGPFTIAFGSEVRGENFKASAGEEASYIGAGSISFPGIQEQNTIDTLRYNVGAYIDVVGEFFKHKQLLIGAAVRFENYSDFGFNFSWKSNVRYSLLDNRLVIRAAASSGFRAPSLHQRYLSIVQTLLSGGTISNQGTFNNDHPVVRQLGVAPLTNETSLNFTAGITASPIKKLFLSLDFYRIYVNDRIVYSSSISSSDTSTLVYQILNNNDITSLKFFTNAVNTVSEGFDFIAQYKGLALGQAGSSFDFALAVNMNRTRLNGTVNTPSAIQEAQVELFDRKEQGRILAARPLSKLIFGITYHWNSLRVQLNNTRFGQVIWQHASNPDLDQVFKAKLITDLNINYDITSSIYCGLNVNNIFNIYPDPIDSKGDVVTNLGGRFLYPWEVNQFGFNGTTFSVLFGVRFARTGK